ncbi:hypothetical protein COV06_00710 [Candidatus Uhrbacteria bacterium CG10_big_fil_rev_8_21_14_0_10_50_16]|uniref:Colicin V production protein n=1 Tax=Candidatus Uhrbacteria bacterium CG10_big_fil_rev_8_21_14_0_10_50_16 TaxID=1975039 RepID=A0A2H0RN25_9BACT|nr:MAG: hypothetical protein COV06_00710 [Candidatus Uhrbacteria bacterium CG10_big_fil_rev_8_21_14_0_10_50_16]
MENLFDIVVLVAIGGFALYGFAVGFVQALTSLVGMCFSILVATRTYQGITAWILPEALSDRFGVQLFVFFLILIFITSLVNMLVRVVDRVFHVVAIIPFTKSLNRLLGLILGLLIGILTVTALVFAATQLPGLPEAFQQALDASIIARWSFLLSGVLVLFFPQAIDQAREAVGV